MNRMHTRNKKKKRATKKSNKFFTLRVENKYQNNCQKRKIIKYSEKKKANAFSSLFFGLLFNS